MTTIVTRASKGSALTYAEMDANFNNLNNNKLETNPPASSIVNTPAGNISATNVQAAINELDTEKLPANATALNGTTIPTSKTLVVTTDISSTVMPWVAPSTSGNILTSNGAIWTSTANASALPTQTGNAGTSLITNGTSVSWGSSINIGTAVATTSGTAIDFTGIPSWVKRVTLSLYQTSTNGTSILIVQLGAGSPQTSGYSAVGSTLSASAASTSAQTTGIPLGGANAAVDQYTGHFTFNNMGNGIWEGSGEFAVTTGGYIRKGVGGVTLSGTLDRVRLTTVVGTDAFDNGSMNIMWE